jgi:hypothetical protein
MVRFISPLRAQSAEKGVCGKGYAVCEKGACSQLREVAQGAALRAQNLGFTTLL